jgi:hypothetical protein
MSEPYEIGSVSYQTVIARLVSIYNIASAGELDPIESIIAADGMLC